MTRSKKAATTLALALASAALPGAADTTSTQTTIARGTVIPILVTKDIRIGANGSTPEEHKVKLAVAGDVIVDGYVIAKAGDLAEGHYDTQSNQTKGTFTTKVSQELILDIDDVVNFCGDTIHTQFERTFVGGVRSGFLSFGVHSHDAVFSRGSVLEASTDRFEKSVCAQATSATPPPLPRDVIKPDPGITPPPSPGRNENRRSPI
ncbi:MAG TPA: hypothetical protein VGI19_02970 [Candidatus Cybelea sp.]|jgi:hypothetical protein